MLTEQLDGVQKTFDTTKSKRTLEKATKERDDLNKQIEKLTKEKTTASDWIKEKETEISGKGDSAFDELKNALGGKE
jgi:soluble cytochrome b562